MDRGLRRQRSGRGASRIVLVALLAASACSSRFPTRPAVDPGAPSGRAVLTASVVASGADPYEAFRDVAVSYRGEWGAVVQRLQPVLTDGGYRRSSEERLLVRDSVVAQIHRGSEGVKAVVRDREGVEVAYDGFVTTDRDVLETSALVADAYSMFLLGPAWLLRHGDGWARLGSQLLDGEPCDLVLGRLRPGVGLSTEDRVVAWVARDSSLLRRVHFTLEGHLYTQGAHVDVTFSDYREMFGRRWPTHFVERVRAPVDVHAHEWRMTGLDVDRGLTRADVGRPGAAEWTERAAAPAAPLE